MYEEKLEGANKLLEDAPITQLRIEITHLRSSRFLLNKLTQRATNSLHKSPVSCIHVELRRTQSWTVRAMLERCERFKFEAKRVT